MKATRLAVAAAAATFLLGAAVGETDMYGNEIKVVDGVTYRFLVSGNPETAAVEKSSSLLSSSTSLSTATHSRPAAASSLEARFRTWFESEGTGLTSTKFNAMVIIVM